MTFLNKFLLLLFILSLLSYVNANHIRTGHIHMEGEIDTAEGTRRYTQDAVLMKPVLCWEDIVGDGVSVSKCNDRGLTLQGEIDKNDISKGVVITFPTEAYKSFGCPIPSYPKEEKEPEVIFRLIESVTFGKKSVTLGTSFINPGYVMPEITVEIGELMTSRRNLRPGNDSSSLLPTSSRVNNVGIQNFRINRSVSPFPELRIDFGVVATGGICRFRFSLFRLRATWEQRIDVSTTISATVARSFNRQARREIFQTAIPGAGVSFNVFLLGRVTVGFVAAVDLETELNIGAAARITVSGRLNRAEEITLGVGRLTRRSLSAGSSGTPSSGITFNTGVAAQARADGFVGLRPILTAEIELPRIPDASVGIGGTLGVQAAVGARTPPFPMTSIRPAIGSCTSCHFVRGSLNVEGRRLSVEAEAPILGTREFVILNQIFSTRVATLCFFPTTCSAGPPLPSLPPAPTRPPPPPPRCPCRCTSRSRARSECNRPEFRGRCRVRGCFLFRGRCC